jgi:hypothetical protein
MSITALKIPAGVSLAQSIHDLRTRVQAVPVGSGGESPEPRTRSRETALAEAIALSAGGSR